MAAPGTADMAVRRERVALSGTAGVVLLLALACLRLIGWPVDGDQSPPYRGETWFVAGLMTAGTGVALVRARWARPALAVAATCALQLVGTGIAARRRWLTSVGFGSGYPAGNLDELRTVASLLAFVAALAALLGVAALAITRDRRTEAAWLRIATGAAVAVLAPLAMGWEPWNRTTQLGAHGLMYGPWGVALAAAVLLRPAQRAAVDAAVVACGVAMLLGEPMIPAPRPMLGVVVLAVAVVVCQFGDQRSRVASSRSSAVSGVGGANA